MDLSFLSFLKEPKKLAFDRVLKKLKKLVKFHHNFQFFTKKSAWDRQNSGGAGAWCAEALFCLDFSLVRFFSSMEKK